MKTFATPESPSGSPETVQIPDKASEIENDSAVPGANVKLALDALLAGGGGAVLSVFGRIGAVVAAVGDYLASEVDNDSGVPGVTVANALDNLLAAIPAVPVSSVYGRIGAVVSAVGDYVASQVNNDSAVAGATVKDALNNLQAAIPGVPVSSVFGRVGAVVAALNDYVASQVGNDSAVAGATVKDALNALQAAIPGVPVSSVFGRIGAVVSAVGDYVASQVNNDSGVTGATVKAALDTLNARVTGVSSVFGRVGAVVSAAGDYVASQVNNDSAVAGATVKDALNTLSGSGGAVSSVFGRVGAVVAAIGDYTTSQVNNSSIVSGATATDAFNALDAVATQSAKGLMSAADKLKLDTLFPVAKLDMTNAWDALYLFEGNLNDSSGNGYHLALGSGTVRYGQFRSQYNGGGLRSISVGYSNCQLLAAHAALRTLGNVTLSILFRPKSIGSEANSTVVFGCSANGALETQNALYYISMVTGASTGSTPHVYGWGSEHGAGVADLYSMSEPLPGPSDPLLLTMVRESNVISTYLNGSLVSTSGALATPTGGSLSPIVLGGGSTSNFTIPMDVACCAIKLGALTPTQVLNDAKRIYGVN